MKHAFKTAVLLPLALTSSMLIAQQRPQRQPPREQPPAEGQAQQDQQQTITGKIARSDDGKYVLVDSANMMYQLDDQRSAKKFAGKNVTVSGTVDASRNSIHVTEIKEAS